MTSSGYIAMFIAVAVATIIGMIAMIFVKPGKQNQDVSLTLVNTPESVR